MNKKGSLSKAEYARLSMRCRWRALRIAKLTNPNDIKVFVDECVENELKQGKQKLLTKEQRLKRPQKLITKQKRREQKPQKQRKPNEHKFIYVNVTPSKSEPVLQDLFVHVENLEPSKKERLDKFMEKHGKVDIETVLKKIEEIENEE